MVLQKWEYTIWDSMAGPLIEDIENPKTQCEHFAILIPRSSTSHTTILLRTSAQIQVWATLIKIGISKSLNCLHHVIATISPMGLCWDVHFVHSSLSYDTMVFWHAIDLTYNHTNQSFKVWVTRLFHGSHNIVKVAAF